MEPTNSFMLENFEVIESEDKRHIRGYIDNIKCFFAKLNEHGYSFSKRDSKSSPGPLSFKTSTPKCFNGLLDVSTIPFQKQEFQLLHCGNGPKYYKTKKDKQMTDHHTGKKQRFRLRSKKMNCPATLSVLKVKFFTDYKLKKNTSWRERKEVLTQLKQDLLLTADTLAIEERYYIALSLDHNHPIVSSSLNQRIDGRLLEEMKHIVDMGNTNVNFIQKALKNFVLQFNIHSSEWCKAFHPSKRTIYNYIIKFMFEKNQTKLDQKAVELQLLALSDDNNANVFYRPYTFNEETNKAEFFLFCYQTKWQRELIERYGDICLLDATYKTTKYSLPLFMLVVKTNVNYCVAGFFIVQHENGKSIAEALKIFKLWNTGWNPQYFMIDFSEPEINAIKKIFQCEIYICVFHRLQAWMRWLKKNCLKDMSTILNLWKNVADSLTVSDLENSLLKLAENPQFCENEKAVKYFHNVWMPHKEKWISAFFKQDFMFKISTNNGIERQNGILKHSYLQGQCDKSLSNVINIIVNSFLPDSLTKYIEENSKLDSSFKVYNSTIPPFLHGRPEHFVKWVYQRFCTAKSVYSRDSIHELGEDEYAVKSETDPKVHYHVFFKKPSCSCFDFIQYRFPCKHLCALMLFLPQQCSFDQFPESYRDSPYLNIDDRFSAFTNVKSGNLKNTLGSISTNTEDCEFPLEEWVNNDEGSNNYLRETIEEETIDVYSHSDEAVVKRKISDIREYARFICDASYNFQEALIREKGDVFEEITRHLVEAKKLTKGLLEADSSGLSLLPQVRTERKRVVPDKKYLDLPKRLKKKKKKSLMESTK